MTLLDKIKAIQSAIGVLPDGQPGPVTWDALYRKIIGTPPSDPTPFPSPDYLDPRSETCIATLLPPVQYKARQLVKLARMVAIDARIISGTRTYAQQDALADKVPKVTNAHGGYSNHNFGLAFDCGIFVDGKYADDALPEREVSALYTRLGRIGKSIGLSWGGDWVGFTDEPHFELRPDWAAQMSESAMLAELRARKAKGVYFL